MALDYNALRAKHKKRDEENWKKEKASKKTTSPSVTSSGSGDIYKPSTQTAKATVSAGDFAGTSKRMTGKIDMRADEEAASLAEKFVNLPEAERQKMITEHISKPNTKVSAAETVLKRQQAESKTAWENEKAEYNRQQAAKKAETVNTPMSEKYNLMTDDELEKSRKETAELLAQREKQTGGKTKQIFELIGAVAKDEEYKADNTLEYLRKESNAASAEATQRYQDKFYSMSDEERELVATVNAYSMNDIRASEYNGAVTTKEYNAAREILKAKYAYSDDDITAMTYFYNRYANERRAQKDDINARLAMAEHPFLESVASVPMGLIGGVAALEGISDSYVDNKRVEKLGIEDQGIDYNHAASRMQRNAQSGRTEFTDTHDFMIGDYDVGDMLYNTALSGLESAAAAAVPGGALILGVNAGTAKANELARRGLSSEQSIMGGIAAGTFEAIFEEVSIGNILKEVDAKTIKDVALNIGKSMLTNFSEESATEIANIMYDSIMHGDKSEEAIQIQNLVSSGKYTEEQARKEVLKGQVLQVIEAGASGALMGAGFGAVGTAGSYIDNAASLAATGATAKKNGMAGAIIAEGQAAPEGSKSRGLADKLAEKQKDKGKVNSYKLGQLAMENSKYSASVTEGTFAGIDSKAKLEEAYETAKLETAQDKSLTEKEKRKSLDSLYTEYQSANTKLSDTKNTETVKSMKDAFNQKLYKELAEVDRAEATNPKIMTEFGEATIDGGNFDSKTEKLGEFKGIFKDKDGDNVVKTTDGIEFKVSDAAQKLTNKTVARLYEKTKDMSAGAANLFIDNYDGESIDEYKRAFDYYYKMGRTGMSISDIRKNDNLFGNYLTAEAQARIANAGLQDREFRKGFTDLSVGRKTDRYRFETKVLQAVGEKRNLEIFVIDEDSDINGTYLAGTNRIVIRRNAEGKLLLRTASHEAFHFIKNQATDDAGKTEVKALEDFVIDALKNNGTDIEAEIARLGAITDGDGNTVYATREDCIEEIVANSMFDAFTNEKFARKLMNENRSLFGKVANRIKEILADIKAAISMLGNSDATIRALKDDVESLEKINTMFDTLLEKAGEKYRVEHESGQKNNTAEAVKYSIHSDSLGDYVKVDVEQNIFDNKNVREMQSIARKIMNQKYKGKVLNVGVKGKAYFNKRSADEYAYPANRRMDDIIKAAKMRSSTELDNLLAISKFVNNEPDDGRHPDATGGWDIYETRFEVANIMFAGEIKIKVTERGFIFYDITQIRRLPVNGNQTETNSAVASGNLLNNSISEVKKSVKASVENLSELKSKRDGLAEESRALRLQIDEIKTSTEYKAFDDEVREVRKNGSRFGGFAAVKEIRQRQKQWADTVGLSALEEKYHSVSEQIHDYDLEIYKLDKAQKEKVTAELAEKVKGFSDNEVTAYAAKATKKFGITNKFDNAGYMLPDGKLLDFSDGHGYRVLDHREIKDVLDFLPDNGNRSDGLVQFMNMGNIRMQIGGIDISKAPSKQQITVLRKFFNENNGEITVDFSKDNGDNAGSVEYPRGTSSAKILNDIKAYFENGSLPQISATAAFHSMYSTKQTSSVQARYAEVLRENRNLKQIISLLDEMQYSSASGNVHLNSKDIDRIARELIKSASSKYDQKEFANELTVIYDYMANSGKNADTEEIYKSLLTIANGILEQSEMKDTELYDQYKNVRDFLRNQPIYITPQVKKEIETQFGDYKSFRNILMGKVMHMTTSDSSARTLDEVWTELAEMAPEYFPKDLNELDMPMQIAAFYEAIAPRVVNPYEHYEENMEDAAAVLATEIFQKFYDVGRLKSPQEKYRNLVFENMRKLENSKKALREEFRQKTAENEQRHFDNYKSRVAEYRQQREAGDRRRRLRNELDRNYNYLNRRIVKETDNDHIPENLKGFVNAFRYIVPDSNSYFSKARFTDFENEYRKLEDVSSFFDEDIARRISELKDRLTPGIGAPKMRDLDNFELEELRNISEHVKYIVQNENRLFSDRLKGKVENFAKAVHNELALKPESRAQGVPENNATWRNKTRNKVNEFIKGLTKPEYLFGSLGSETLKSLYDELRRGENTEARILADARAAEQEIKRKYNYDPRWEKQKITIDFRSGKMTITVEQAMALYAASKRKQGLEHMLNGGVVLYTLKEEAKKNGKVKTDVKRERHVFNETDLPILDHALTDEQKNYVNAMVGYISQDIGRKRNEISLKLNGIEKYKEKFYFPIKVDRNFVDTSVGRQEVVSTIKNQSSAKRTVNHAHNPIEIAGFTETVNNHIYDSALYCAYVLPINDFKRVYNFRDTVFEGEGVESLIRRDLSVKEDIRRTNGVNAIKQIEDFMIALDSGSRYENLMPFSAKLAARAKKVSTMANLSVVIQQPTAVFRAMLYVEPKHFATLANKADIAEMKKWNGCALKKEIGYFDVNMGRTATDYINEYSPDKQEKKDWSIKNRIENGNIMLTIDQVAGWGATKADEMTWGAIWKACKKQTKAENAELTGDALNAAASELFQKVISKTQVYDSVFTKPDYMRRKEGFAMLATQFMSEPLTSLNMLAEAVCKARNAKGSTQQNEARKFCGRAFACYMTSLVVNSALKSLVYTMRDDDEDESFLEKYIANVTESLATEPFGMIPYVKDILSIVQGDDLNRMDVAVFSTFADAIKTLFEENPKPTPAQADYAEAQKEYEKKVRQKILKVMKAAGQASGIPVYNVVRDADAIWNNVFVKIVDGVKNGFEPTTGRGVLNELRETFDYLPFVDAQDNYDQLYNAVVDGDTRHYEKVYNNLIADGREESTINSELASRLAKNDGRVATAYEAMADADAVTAASKVAELKAAGFSDEVINRALNRYETNLEKAVAKDERIARAAQARYNMDYDEYERIIKEMVAEGYRENIVRNAADSAKIELETKAYEFAVGDKDMYTASYDLRNALVNGDSSDVKAVYEKLVEEAGEEKAASEVRKYAKSAFKNDIISETQTRLYLKEYSKDGADNNDIFWEMEELKGGDGYEKYGKLYDAVDSGRNVSNTVSYYTEHGVELKTVKSNITKEYKPRLTRLTPGTAEYTELYNNIIDAFVATGDSEQEAIKKVNKWFD